jgi:hypothetical protein
MTKKKRLGESPGSLFGLYIGLLAPSYRLFSLSDSFENSDQDNGADQGYDETPDVKAGHTAAHAEKAKNPAPKHSPDNTHDDIQDNTLLAIGAHEYRSDPTDETSKNDVSNKAHTLGVDKNKPPAPTLHILIGLYPYRIAYTETIPLFSKKSKSMM